MTLATMLLATTLAIAGFSGIDLVERFGASRPAHSMETF